MGNRFLQGIKAIIQRQQGLAAEGHDNGFFLMAQDSGSRLLRSHRQVLDGIAPVPLRNRLGVDAMPLGQLPYALFTILYRSAGFASVVVARG